MLTQEELAAPSAKMLIDDDAFRRLIDGWKDMRSTELPAPISINNRIFDSEVDIWFPEIWFYSLITPYGS